MLHWFARCEHADLRLGKHKATAQKVYRVVLHTAEFKFGLAQNDQPPQFVKSMVDDQK